MQVLLILEQNNKKKDLLFLSKSIFLLSCAIALVTLVLWDNRKLGVSDLGACDGGQGGGVGTLSFPELAWRQSCLFLEEVCKVRL